MKENESGEAKKAEWGRITITIQAFLIQFCVTPPILGSDRNKVGGYHQVLVAWR